MFEAWEYVKEHGLVTGGGYGSQKVCYRGFIRIVMFAWERFL